MSKLFILVLVLVFQSALGVELDESGLGESGSGHVSYFLGKADILQVGISSWAVQRGDYYSDNEYALGLSFLDHQGRLRFIKDEVCASSSSERTLELGACRAKLALIDQHLKKGRKLELVFLREDGCNGAYVVDGVCVAPIESFLHFKLRP